MASNDTNMNNINSFLEFIINDNLGEIGVVWGNWKTEINQFLSMDETAIHCYKNFINHYDINSNIDGNKLPNFERLTIIINDINQNLHLSNEPKEYQFGYDLWGNIHH